MSAMYVGADHIPLRLSIASFNKFYNPRLDLGQQTSAIAVVAVQDFVLVHDDWLKQSILIDVIDKLVEVLFSDWRKHRRERMRHASAVKQALECFGSTRRRARLKCRFAAIGGPRGRSLK